MGYWDEVKRVYGAMVEGDFGSVMYPDQNQGSSNTGTGGSGSYEEWRMIHQKFRDHVGRDPYSLQELKDWWSRY